ncbi:uncharacterized protein LOC122069344 [Macadamia integrifolia]|uniref:uncharacterized protein LOC122069344 n=1 Tax=Macadamia integrifolia TaxID=60698 RepID=UPI001C4F2D57|nr:uncharacterized protein LOC122069344 [Macadamia integrifolia]
MALRKIVRDNDPDFLCLDELMIDVNKCPTRYFRKLGFEVDVICNTRRENIPNLWLLWKRGIPKPSIFSSSDQQISVHKLKRLRPIIKTWARENFPNFEIELVRTREALDQIQAQIELQGMDDSLFGQEADAKSAYLVAMKNHEKLWAEKSRIRWLKEGDRNSKFFHLYTKVKRAKNTIRRVKKIDESIISDRGDLACYMSKFYEDFQKRVLVTDHLDLLDAIPRLIDEVNLLSLDLIPGPNEIKRAVWDLDPDSSPGPYVSHSVLTEPGQ